jgi:RNA polymerase sigma factor (sigma-70 family)
MASSSLGPERDAELAVLSRAGDVSAYEELARRHYDDVYRMSYALLRDPDQAADATQECFVTAYRGLRRFDGRRPFAPWLRGIAVRCAMSVGRRHRRAARPTPPEAPNPDQAAPHAAAATRELQAAVREAVSRLPQKQRMAVTLFALEGASVHDVATTMGCAVGTVKAHLHKARRNLRKALSHRLGEQTNGL